jgi:hypothetical protein
VTFKNWDNSTLQTVNNVPYGGSANYTGVAPTNNSTGNIDDFEFIGWSPLPINIVAATTCVAQYKDVSSLLAQYLRGTITEYVSDTNTTIADYGLANQSSLKRVAAPITNVSIYGLASSAKIEEFDFKNTNTIRLASYLKDQHKLKSLLIRSSDMSTMISEDNLDGT